MKQNKKPENQTKTKQKQNKNKTKKSPKPKQNKANIHSYTGKSQNVRKQ